MRLLLLTVVILSMIGCSSATSNEKQLTEYEQKKITDSLYKLEGEALKNKYNAIGKLDTIKYSHQLQGLLNNNTYPVIMYGKITDISKSDKDYVIHVSSSENGTSSSYIAAIKADSSEIKKIESSIYRKDNIRFGYFVFKAEGFKRYYTKIDSEVGDDSESSYLFLDTDRYLTSIDGILIDYDLKKPTK